MPENFYDETTDMGIEYGYGDETVPLVSANNIISNKTVEISASHNDLPTKAQCYIIKELTGKDDCEYVDSIDRIVNILTFGVFSPIDIQIIAPDGKRVGKDFETGEIYNEIEGAYYSGYGTENEFLTIPNPLEGEYKVLTQGTGSGDFKIETVKISEQADGSAQEATRDLVGTAVSGSLDEFTVNTAELVAVDDEDQDDSDAASESESSSDSSDDDDSSSDSDSSDSKKHNNNSSDDDGISVALAGSQSFSVDDGRDMISVSERALKAENNGLSYDIKNNQSEENEDEDVGFIGWIAIKIVIGIVIVCAIIIFVRRKSMLIFSGRHRWLF